MITKVIPVAAGLAGGSDDAATTLRGLNRLWDLKLSAEELAELGAEIGSDVSFCVYGALPWQPDAVRRSGTSVLRLIAGSCLPNRRSGYRLPKCTAG